MMQSSTAPAALSRGLQVLELLARNRESMSFSAIAAALGTSNASTMRLLKSLQELGYIEKLPDHQGYRNSERVTGLAGPQGLRRRFQSAARPFLSSLMERCGNTAISIYWTGQFMVCLDRVMHEDASPLQEPGHVASNLHAAPWGWLMKPLSWWQQQPAKKINGKNEKGYRLSTGEIIDNLKRLPERGFTYLPGPERRRLAAPVYHADNIIGALCLGGNIFTMPDDQIEHDGRLLAAAAEACSDLIRQ